MLPGLSCIDLFGQRLLPRLGDDPVLLIALPPGQEADDARRSLASAGLLELGSLSGPGGLLASVAEEIGADAAADVESLILRNVDRLRWPRQFLGVLAPEAPLDGLLEVARRFADLSRDLSGPLRFVLLAAPRPRWPTNLRPLVWEPQFGVPHPLPFHLPNRSLRDAGFDTFLACRLYWEAAGRPSHMRVLAEGLLRRATELLLASDADERVDRVFDECWERSSISAEDIHEVFREACDRGDVRAVLRTGILARPRVPLEQLEVVGLCWRPPGTVHALLTPIAAFQLSRTAMLNLQPRERIQLRRAARHNQLLGAWVLQLTGQIERELVWRCQRDGRTEERLAEAGLLERLRAELQRGRPELAYCPSNDPLDYASFGELVQLLARSGLGTRPTVSRPLLEEARHARNLSAHLHPVTWRAISSVLQLLEQLMQRVN